MLFFHEKGGKWTCRMGNIHTIKRLLFAERNDKSRRLGACLSPIRASVATDIDALRNRSLHQLAAIEGEPGIIHLPSSIFHQTDCHLLLAEVEVEDADGLPAGFGLACSKVAEELEVCAEGADRHCGARIVERVVGAEVELSVVALQLQSAGEAEPGAIAEDEMHVTALHDDGLEVGKKKIFKTGANIRIISGITKGNAPIISIDVCF